ncbi:MAG: transcriptional regulator with XRE-family HTH domain [Nitrospinales bacterium]|jgi:transcriptional regulator with XRE-family HTH domain
MVNMGARIKILRTGLRLNQTAFAKQLSLSGPAVVSKYEKNLREPEVAILVKIAKLGNKSLDWLLTGNSSSKKAGGSNKLDMLITQLESIYHEGDPKKLSAIQTLIDLASPEKPIRKRNKS